MQRLNIPLHSGQRFIMQHRKRYNVCSMGRRFGKTRLAFALVLEVVLAQQNAVYVTPTATDFEKRWMEAERTFTPILKETRVSDGIMLFRGGGRLDFYGLHRYDAARGNYYSRAIFDEAAHSDNLGSAWSEVFRPALMDLHGDAYFFSTPNYRQSPATFKDFYSTASTKNRWRSYRAPSSANPFLDPAEIEAAREDPNTPELIFRQEYLAEFVDIAGTLVKREYIDYYHTMPQCTAVSMGVDLAISQRTQADYSSIVVTGKDSHGKIYVLDVWRAHTSFHETKEQIERMARQWQPASINIEAVQYQAAMIQELVRTTQGLNIQAAKADKDKISRFMPALGKLEHNLVYCRNVGQTDFINELLTFPSGEHDDMVDAFVYSLRGLESGFWIA